jgi:hypothetical protein
VTIANRTIAVCDILGFKKLVRNNSLDDVVHKGLGEFRKTLYRVTHHREPLQEIPSLQGFTEQSRVGVAWFSDTILFYSLEDTEEDCRRVIESTAWLIFFAMPNRALRVRGAMSYGEVFIDQTNGLYIGAPIIEAYELQELQNWSGGALAQTVVGRIPQEILDPTVVDKYDDWYLTDYPVPLKSSDPPCNDIHWAIDWTRGIHDETNPWTTFPWLPSSDEPTEEDRRNSPDKVIKWTNTRKFHTAKCKFCLNGR